MLGGRRASLITAADFPCHRRGLGEGAVAISEHRGKKNRDIRPKARPIESSCPARSRRPWMMDRGCLRGLTWLDCERTLTLK